MPFSVGTGVGGIHLVGKPPTVTQTHPGMTRDSRKTETNGILVAGKEQKGKHRLMLGVVFRAGVC